MNAYNLLLFTITFLFIISCKESTQVETNIDLEGMLNITKTEVGINIYSNQGILIPYHKILLLYHRYNLKSLKMYCHSSVL